MARALLGEPDVLLMDEPTNHLDIESIIWLEAFLKSRSGALLMTSHDRDFMNRIVTKIAEIDGGEITTYSGNPIFMSASVRSGKPIGKRPMRASRRCSPKNNDSSSDLSRMPRKRRRCRAV
jgi:ATPase subunit of ABC transporter with duplicated ATPase domains